MKRTRSASEEGDGPKQPIDAALLEEWALFYLGRYASTAENLRQVLRRRVRRRLAAEGEEGREAAAAVEPLIDALVARYRETGLVNDASYAAGRARPRLGSRRSSGSAAGPVSSIPKTPLRAARRRDGWVCSTASRR